MCLDLSHFIYSFSHCRHLDAAELLSCAPPRGASFGSRAELFGFDR
jgi:hypothetical protein